MDPCPCSLSARVSAGLYSAGFLLFSILPNSLPLCELCVWKTVLLSVLQQCCLGRGFPGHWGLAQPCALTSTSSSFSWK